MAPSPPDRPLATCPKHRLPYDPHLVRSCELCRKERQAAAPPPPPSWVGPVGAALAVAGGLAVIVPFARSVQASLQEASPPAPEVAPPAPATPPPACLRVPAIGENAFEIATMARACQAACDARSGRACRRLAGLCSPAARESVAPAPETACAAGAGALLDQACTLGDAIACGVRDDQRKAVRSTAACAAGEGPACADLAALCAPSRGMFADDGPPTRWAFLAAPDARQACEPGVDKLVTRACELGDAPSCDRLPPDARPGPERMRSLLEVACDRRQPAACRSLATLMGATDPATATSLVRYAADLEACLAAGSCASLRPWRDARSAPGASPADRLDAVDRGCAEGDPLSCWQASELAASSSPPDGARASRLTSLAHKHLRDRCGPDGASAACLSPDADRRLDACDAGDGLACLDVARALPGGVAPLTRRALRLLLAACEAPAPDGASCRHAASLLAGTDGLTPEPERTPLLLSRGCTARDAESCHALASRMFAADGVPLDKPGAERMFRRAAELFRASCEAGDRAACPRAAELYEQGRGVGRDEARARALRARAAP